MTKPKRARTRFSESSVCRDQRCAWRELNDNIAQGEALVEIAGGFCRKQRELQRLTKKVGRGWVVPSLLWAWRYLWIERLLRAAVLRMVNH